MSMRILVTCESISEETGGGRTGILGLCRALQDDGHSIWLATTTSGMDTDLVGNIGEFSSYEGINVAFFESSFQIMGNHYSLSFNQFLKNHCQDFDLVLIHSIYRFTSTIAAWRARSIGVPYVLRPHGTLTPFLIDNRRSLLKKIYIRFFEKPSFKNAAAVQFSSTFEMREAFNYVQDIPNPVVIPEGIDVESYRSIAANISIFEVFPELKGRFVILFLGRLHPKKGLDLLLNAFQQIQSARPEAHLILAGTGDDQYVQSLVEWIDDLDIGTQVTITGRVSEQLKRAALAESDVFILPSFGENFGLAVVEAMSSGLPVVVSDKVGISDSIAQSGAGLVVECEYDQISAAVIQLIDDPDLRGIIAEKSVALARSEFDQKAMGRKMTKLFLSVVRDIH